MVFRFCFFRRVSRIWISSPIMQKVIMNMTTFIALIGLSFVVAGALSISMAPDILAMGIVAFMMLVVALGYIFSMIPAASYTGGFKRGLQKIEELQNTQSVSPWVAAQQTTIFFNQRTLDNLFSNYVAKTRQQNEEGLTPGDLEDIINIEGLSNRAWRSVVQQIPGTLTALGLLGTFVGLITGISTISFSSVDSALSSITVLLAGIQTAFFTSIVGVILSILFNLTNKMVWNITAREMDLFMEQFHFSVLPSLNEQLRAQNNMYMKEILDKLDRLVTGSHLQGGNVISAAGESADEARLMPEISEGIKNGEFIFYLQPRYNLSSRKVVGGEALVRWNRKDLGIVSPSAFLHIVEQNGYIAQIDKVVWNNVVETIRKWVDSGQRPMPISINISKTDILSFDVADYLTMITHRLKIPPRFLELEISEAAYLQCESIVKETESILQQNGFRVIIDGFTGTLSSIKALGKYSADAVKLDIRHIKGNTDEYIGAVYEQARKMNCPVMAEGIENSEQLAILRNNGCMEGQGYFFSKPISVEEFEKMMNQELN